VPGRYRTGSSGGSRLPPDRRGFAAVNDSGEPNGESMRNLRRLHASAVIVVTTTDGDGFHGLTVSAFTIVSLDPATILACIATGNDVLERIMTVGRFAVSLLGDDQEFLAERFARRAPLVDRRFTGVKHRLSRSGNPVLESCLAWFDCAVENVQPRGDHTVVFGLVKEAGYGEGGSPLLYFDGAYRFLQAD
jgi:flavin reductase (DIM6/NTAB) family NADH-FMN oxidoreductase RutF